MCIKLNEDAVDALYLKVTVQNSADDSEELCVFMGNWLTVELQSTTSAASDAEPERKKIKSQLDSVETEVTVTGETDGWKRDKFESKHPQDRDKPEIAGKTWDRDRSQVPQPWSYKDFRELPSISRATFRPWKMKISVYCL